MKKVLVVVDMQNDFIDGALGTIEAQRIVSDVKREIETFRNNGDLVIFTADCHGEDYLNTQEGKNLPVVHCVKGTNGYEIRKSLNVGDSKVFDKKAFGSVELAQYLVELNTEEEIEEIVFCGICTDICVISNVMLAKAFLPETLVTVKEELCAGVTPKSHKNALEAMKMCQVNVI